jgi:Mrp family chromosome partitioning ATPase
VLLVVNSKHTARDVASAAIERLDAVGTAVVGVVLNQVELDRRANSYLPYYHQTYKAYYSERDDEFLPPEISATSLKAEAGIAASPVKS